jgi:hypothetical protein
MRLQLHARNLVVFRSSINPADRHGAAQDKRRARCGRIRRFMRIGTLLAVVAVRPRWRHLLAATVLIVLGVAERQGVAGIVVIPGLLLLWQAMLIPADTDADRERRSQLKRELGAYSTAAQRRDLEATLDLYPDEVTYEIREILATQALASHGNRIPGARSY